MERVLLVTFGGVLGAKIAQALQPLFDRFVQIQDPNSNEASQNLGGNINTAANNSVNTSDIPSSSLPTVNVTSETINMEVNNLIQELLSKQAKDPLLEGLTKGMDLEVANLPILIVELFKKSFF